MKSVSLSKVIEIKLVWKLQIGRKNSISKDQANYSLTPIKWVQTIHEVEFGFHETCMYLRISYSIDDLIFENKSCEIVGVKYHK